MDKKPHIIIFNPDQMQNAALGHMQENPAAQTPFLDAFAGSEAASYRNAFCQNPVCVPSRCSFLTGLYPHVHGHRTMNHMLQPQESSMLQELKEAGYHVWMNARNDFLPAQVDGIFDQHVSEIFYGGDIPPPPGPETVSEAFPHLKNPYSHYGGKLPTGKDGRYYGTDDEVVDAAIRRIQNPVEDKPMCLFIGLFNPHPAYQVEEPYYSAIDRAGLPPRSLRAAGSTEPKIEGMIRQRQGMEDCTDAEWNELRAVYHGQCLKVDAMFRRLCDSLKEAGIYDDSAIFFFSDHGDYQGQFGLSEKNQNTFCDLLVRVPFLVKPPKGIAVEPGINKNLVELVDFYATAMDFAGVQPGHTHFGRSLRGSIANPALPVREYTCCEGGRRAGEVHCDESHTSGPDGIQPGSHYWPRVKSQEDDTAHTKATMLRTARHKYVRRLYEGDQLFDMKADPGETTNLIDEPTLQGVLLDMKEQMLSWYQDTCDVVPFRYDARFSKEMIWHRAKNICPPEYAAQVRAMIDQGDKTMFEILAFCQKLRKENAK